MEQHQIGEAGFQRRYGMDLRELAAAFAKQSPYRQKLSLIIRRISLHAPFLSKALDQQG